MLLVFSTTTKKRLVQHEKRNLGFQISFHPTLPRKHGRISQMDNSTKNSLLTVLSGLVLICDIRHSACNIFFAMPSSISRICVLQSNVYFVVAPRTISKDAFLAGMSFRILFGLRGRSQNVNDFSSNPTTRSKISIAMMRFAPSPMKILFGFF
jgi:hypothetical protein